MKQPTKQDIDDIVCTALEGGITYWCYKAKVCEDKYFGEYASDQISRGGSLELFVDDEDETFILNEENFLNGLEMYCKENKIDYADPAEIDANDADCIIQYAVFGEVVYG